MNYTPGLWYYVTVQQVFISRVRKEMCVTKVEAGIGGCVTRRWLRFYHRQPREVLAVAPAPLLHRLFRKKFKK